MGGRLTVLASAATVLVLMVAGHVYHPGLLLSVPIVAFVLLGLVASDALTIRLALEEYAMISRARLKADDPRDLASAEAWLADPVNDTASPVRRAGILASLNRAPEARAILDRSAPADPIEAAYADRLRIAFAEQPATVDREAFEAAVAVLEPNEARWQRLALATTIVHRDIGAGRPWKQPYVATVRRLGPWHPGVQGWLLVAFPQFSGAIVFAILLGILAFVAQLPFH